ncbi:hypothetical protein [Paenarthrobacter nitroguajacolicus]|uniref:hypothetical protein n=1 Tax=Paenarthrobacter nitroguajacolicus TaxID=211146 RepID=UPI00343C4B7A
MVLLASLTISACSIGEDDNADQLSNPFDAFNAEALDTVRVEERRLRLDCLAAEGFPQFRDAMAGYQATESARDRIPAANLPTGLFLSEDDAKRRGFGESLPASLPKVIVRDAAIDEATNKCMVASWAAIGRGSESIYNAYVDTQNNLSSALLAVPVDTWSEIIDFTAKCLAGKGHAVSGDSNSRYGMTFSVPMGKAERREPLEPPTAGNFSAPGLPAVPYIPTEQESALAVDYYDCTVESGYRDEYVQERIRAANSAMSEYEGQLSELTPKIEALAKSATAAKFGAI